MPETPLHTGAAAIGGYHQPCIEFTERLMGKGFSVSLPLEEAAAVEKEANRLGLPAASIIRLMMRDGQQRRELEHQMDDLKARVEKLQVQMQGLQILLETIALEQSNARGPQALENRKALIQEIRKRQGFVERLGGEPCSA
jgi:TolA-binding protein